MKSLSLVPIRLDITGIPRLPILTCLLGVGSLFLTTALQTPYGVALDIEDIAFSWRWFTCHFAHWNVEHLIWSGGTFLVLGAMCEMRNAWAYATALIASMLLIPLLQLLLQPDFRHYVGLSGIDCALFVMFAVWFVRDQVKERQWLWALTGAAMLLGFCAKVGYEAHTGNTVFISNGGNFVAVPSAHLTGGVVGLLAALIPSDTTLPLLSPKCPPIQ